jgi:hypothetical protein
MKKLIFVSLFMVALALIVFAASQPMDIRPRALALPQAYELSQGALGPLTNDYFCLHASAYLGDWWFVYYTTNASYYHRTNGVTVNSRKCVQVRSDKTTSVQSDLPAPQTDF